MMNVRTIDHVDFTNKRVLIRVDFNVLLDEKKDAQDMYKLTAARETIEHVRAYPGVRIALMSHRGRPHGVKRKMFTMAYLADDISRLLGIDVRPVCESVGVCVVEAMETMQAEEVILLENLRFHAEETTDDDLFAQQLAAPFDMYINDAFSVCHRAHASIHAITRHIPSFAGRWLIKEITHLSRIKDHPESPSVAIIGGAKIDTKLPLIQSFERKYDHVLVGGRVALEAQEQSLTFSDHVVLPADYVHDHLDIGPKTVENFVSMIASAKTIVWNGPMGKFEQKPYDAGTIALAKALAKNTQAFSVVGGGESVQALHKSGCFDAVSFVSTGGGAMLAFLSGEELPGLRVLQEDYKVG